MKPEIRNPNDEAPPTPGDGFRASGFVILSSFVIRHLPSLTATSQHRLEMRRLFFAGHDGDFHFLEAGRFEPSV